MKTLFPAFFLLNIIFSSFCYAQSGENLFEERCATCHLNPVEGTHTPSREDMALFTPNSVYAAISSGRMQVQATGLSDDDLRALTLFVTGSEVSDFSLSMEVNLCENNPVLSTSATANNWNGWGPDVQNTRFQSLQRGGISAADVPKLRLKWAYGLPGEGQPRAQAAVFDGTLFVGNGVGALYALDADTGCTYWSFLPRAGIRSALSVGEIELGNGEDGVEGGVKGHAVFFVDASANAYAVNASTGEQIWVNKVDDHATVRGTGSVTLYDGRLYVPMSGVGEENAASSPDYPCCTFRGSISSLDANTGELVWKYYTVAESQRRGESSTGTPLYGPAGVGIWSAPSIDVERGLLYAATGNAYAEPTPETSDAVIALSLASGELKWVKQLLPSDAWIGGCNPDNPNPNCPDEMGPDFDFSASPLLTRTPSGKELLIVPQKSGMAYAIDPANEGELVWQYRFGNGSGVGGVWGMSVGDGLAYAAVGGYFQESSGGIHGIDIETGERAWFTPPEELLCAAGPGCSATQSAAVTAIPGAVFSGSADGGMRAYGAESGEILWTFDANRSFQTINGVEANGGSFDGSGPVIADGMVYFLSGNAGFVGRSGNVLLAFELAE